MKLLYVVIDGMGDLPIQALGNKTPLEAATTPNLDLLARKGQTGLMYTVGKGVAPESDVAVISLLGYDPFKYSTGRGVIEAVGAGLTFNNGDLALRCNFATLGEGRKILDRRVARSLTTEEAAILTKAANDQVKLESCPANFEFKNTFGHRAVLVIKNKICPLSSNITNSDPAYTVVNGIGVATPHAEMVLKTCQATENSEGARTSALLVNEFINKTHQLWESHEVNRKRAAKGKLKANVLLTRDASHLLPNFFDINERYNLNFAALADMQAESGIAKLAGMTATLLPPPSGNLKKDCEIRVNQILEALPKHDAFYIHLKGPDEPGHDGDCHLKTAVISAIDEYFFGHLLREIQLNNFVICVTSDHATPCSMKVHSDTPVPVLISDSNVKPDTVTKFGEKACKKGSLGVIEHGFMLMPKLVERMKK
jgi:2,3-bisphosphoglycerate-independent phosphoglycerate mutase